MKTWAWIEVKTKKKKMERERVRVRGERLKRANICKIEVRVLFRGVHNTFCLIFYFKF